MRGGPRGIPLGLTGLLLVCSLLLGGCGGAATPTSAAAGFSTTKYAQQIAVTADPQGGLRWDRQEYEAQAGAVTFVVGNDPIVLAAESGGGGVSDRLHPAGSSGGGDGRQARSCAEAHCAPHTASSEACRDRRSPRHGPFRV
jgi:hypothetical protein